MGIYSGEEQPKELADFIFKYTDKFSKERLGEFLSDEGEFNEKVLVHYVKHFSFEGVFLPDAFRYFLTFLELAGESQKIERVCYKFAYRYLEEHPDYMSEDGICIFTFLMVMCHTQLYNPNIEPKHRMSLEAFISMASRCEQNREPPSTEFCTKVYTNILNKPLAIHWAQKRRDFLKEALSANAKKKEELCKIETTKILEELDSNLELLKEQKEKKTRKNFRKETESEDTNQAYLKFGNMNLLKPFLSSMWKELFAFFSILIENMPDDSDFSEVVQCATRMMKLADLFDMDEERDAFITVFIQFSGLDLIENRELTGKNLYFIRTLIGLGANYPNNLHKGWKIVLNTVIKIDYYRDLGAGAEKKARLEKGEQKQRGKRDVEFINSQNISNLLSSASSSTDSIFINTLNIDQRSITDLVASLCLIAQEKIGRKDFSDVFFKILSCLDLNFKRPIEELLEILSAAIAKTYVEIIRTLEESNFPTKETDIMVVVDSLKQILERFLGNKTALSKGYQPLILAPLLEIAQKTTTCFEFISQYTAQIGLKRLKTIGKGWITVFQVLAACVERTKEESVSRVAAQLVDGFVQDLVENFEHVIDDVASLMKLVSLLLSAKNPKVAESANRNLRKVTTVLAQVLGFGVAKESAAMMEQPEKLAQLSKIAKERIPADRLIAVTMMPVISSLFSVSGKSRREVESGVELGLEIFKSFSGELDREGWKSLYLEVLGPLVDASLASSRDLARRGQSKEEDLVKLMKGTLKEFYFMITESKEKDLILDYMSFFNEKMSSGDPNFIEIFSETVVDIMLHKPFPEIIKTMVDIVCSTFSKNIPRELTSNKTTAFIVEHGLRDLVPGTPIPDCGELDLNVASVQGKCFLVVELIKLVKRVVVELHTTIEAEDAGRLVEKVEECHSLASTFNSDILLRLLLWQRGYNHTSSFLPSLYKIEKATNEIMIVYASKRLASAEAAPERLAAVLELLR